MNETATTKGTPTLLDEYDIASYSNLPIDEARAMLILTDKAYECNGVYFVKTDEVPIENFDQSLIKEAQAYIKRSRVLEFIEDNCGCRRSDIRQHMESIGEKPSYDSIDLMLTILTEEGSGIYEEDDDTLWSI